MSVRRQSRNSRYGGGSGDRLLTSGLDLASKCVSFGLMVFFKNLGQFPKIRRFHLKLWTRLFLKSWKIWQAEAHIPSFLHVVMMCRPLVNLSWADILSTAYPPGWAWAGSGAQHLGVMQGSARSRAEVLSSHGPSQCLALLLHLVGRLRVGTKVVSVAALGWRPMEVCSLRGHP